MYTLGINAAYHDPAACLVQDGRVIAAAEEERFTRIKHGKRPIPFSTYELPFHAIDYCLREAGLKLTDVDHVAYSYDPYLRLGGYRGDETITLPLEPSAHPAPLAWESGWDPLFLSSIVNAPRHLVGGIPHHLQDRLACTQWDIFSRWHFVEHHIAHQASAFLASPFDHAAILTLDGRGERATTTYAIGLGNQITPIGQVEMPHSLGLLYEQVTEHLGFLHACDEGKVMALASYGKPAYMAEFRDIIRLGLEGQYTIHPLRLTERFGPRRLKGQPIEPRHANLACSLQAALEEAVLMIAAWLRQTTWAENLCLAGGVGLNCVLNARLRDKGLFKQVWVQPAPGDAGTALGAALWIDMCARQGEDATLRQYRMEHAFLGPAFSPAEIETLLVWAKLPYRHVSDIAQATVDLLVQDKLVGWVQGRMEFGPRALGARSILAAPFKANTRDRLNALKGREEFRPVAPVVLQEAAGDWFTPAGASPFMLFVHDVAPGKAERIPAALHVDGTARIQTINRTQHPLYYDLLKAFQARTGVPVLINTSFNIRGQPIVCTPQDALACFWGCPLDALVIGPFILEKPEHPA